MYVFGAILIYKRLRASFIVYTSNIFAILGLRATCLLPLRYTAPTRTPHAAEWSSRLKVSSNGRFVLALVLLSMFFFY